MRNLIHSICMCLAVFCLYFAHAENKNEAIAIELLLSKDDSVKIATLKTIIDSHNIDYFPLLGAINDKRLFVLDQQFITTGNKINDPNKKEALFEIFTVYPSFEPLLNKDGNIKTIDFQDLIEVKFSRTERLILSPVTPYLNLTNPDPDKRKIAYSQLLNTSDLSTLPMIKKALSLEKRVDVIRIATETIYAIELKNTKNEIRAKELVDSLYLNVGPGAATILTEYKNTIDSKSDLSKHIAYTLKSINSRYKRIEFTQNIFSGVSLGSILILIAVGLSIIYGLAGIINMAHGEFLMIGAYTTFCMQELLNNTFETTHTDLFFWISLPLSFFVAGSIGLIIERLIIRHLYNKPLESLLATWGVSLVFIQGARTIFGDLTAVKTPEFLSGGWEIVPQLVLPYNRLFIIILCLSIIALTYSMLYYSSIGRRIRAVTQNRSMSACLGISTRKIDAMTFFFGSGLAGLAGCAMTLIGNVVPDMGQTYIVDSFLVVVTGGVGKLIGTIISGLGIGTLTKFLEPIFEAVYGKVIILVLIILFLQFKPKGLFPDKGRIGDE